MRSPVLLAAAVLSLCFHAPALAAAEPAQTAASASSPAPAPSLDAAARKRVIDTAIAETIGLTTPKDEPSASIFTVSYIAEPPGAQHDTAVAHGKLCVADLSGGGNA